MYHINSKGVITIPLGRKISKGNLIGSIGSLKQYTAPNPTTKAVDQIAMSTAKDILMNMLLDYIDDDQVTLAIWKAGLTAMLSNDLRKQAEATNKARPM